MIWIVFTALPFFLQQEEWLPLEKGRTWIYSTSAEIEMTVCVVEKENLGEISCSVLETTFDGKSSREWLGRDEEGVKLFQIRVGVTDVSFEEPVLRIRLPLKAGEKWLSRMNDAGRMRALNFSVEGPVNVTVGGSTYACMKVISITRAGRHKVVSESWYARGVGMVRQKLSTGKGTLVAELKKVEMRRDGKGN